MSGGSALPRIDGVVFDIVGTLVDEVGTMRAECRRVLEPLGVASGDAVTLADTWVERFDAETAAIASGEKAWAADPTLRVRLLSALLEERALQVPAASLEDLAGAGARLVPWPGVPEQLTALCKRTTVAGLTNASMEQIVAISRRGGLRWHGLLSTELAQTFKPADAAYQLAVRLLGHPEHTLFVACHPWDLRGAAEHGFMTAYLPRPYADPPSSGDQFDCELVSLDELVALLSQR